MIKNKNSIVKNPTRLPAHDPAGQGESGDELHVGLDQRRVAFKNHVDEHGEELVGRSGGN